MALLIEKNVTVLGDVNISQLYIRFRLDYDVLGNMINVTPNIYTSKIAYEMDLQNNNVIELSEIPSVITIDYDRTLDGADLLTVVHGKVKTLLSTDIYEPEPVYDPSTGEIVMDPSTGDPVYEDVIKVEKFAQDSSISIVDID